MYSELFNLERVENVQVANNLYLKKMKEYPSGGSSISSYEFAVTFLNSFYKKKIDHKQLENIIVDCSADGGIDAFHIDKDFIDIFDFKYKAGISTTDLERTKITIGKYIINRESDFTGDEAIKANIKKILLSKNKNKKIRLIIAREKIPYSKEELKNFSKTKKGNAQIKNIVEGLEKSNIEVVFKDIESLFLDSTSQDFRVGVVSLDIEKDLFAKNQNNSKDIVAKVSLHTLFLNLVNIYGDKIINSNVRGYLNKKSFSNKIIETLKTDPKSFYLFHNGITITCSKVEPCSPNAISVTLHNPQIVNGAQTIFSLFYAHKEGLLSLKEVKESSVLCKIIEADQEFTKKICETSNTQNAVNLEDLRSNDEIQVFLEKYLSTASKGRIEYKRKKGSSKRGAIKSSKLFQLVYASMLEEPAKAKNDKQFLFDIVTNRGKYRIIENVIKNNLEKILPLCEISIFVDKVIKSEKIKYKKSMLKHMDLHIKAALFHLNSTNRSDLRKIYNILEKYYKEQILKDKTLNENKVFTKSNKAWIELKKNI